MMRQNSEGTLDKFSKIIVTSTLLFVFAGLVKEGWLHMNELAGLDKGKLSKIAALARMSLSIVITTGLS